MSVVAKAHQNLTFTTPPNLQRAVAVGLAKDDAYFAGLAGDLEAKRDHLVAGLQAAGFRTLPSGGSYFVLADYSALDPDGNDAAFCVRLAESAGVAAIPAVSLLCDEAATPPRALRLLQADRRSG